MPAAPSPADDAGSGAALAEALKLNPEGLRAWAASLVEAREKERLHIARSLHDELGQLLTSLKLELAALAAGVTDPVMVQRVAAMKNLINETLVAVRRISDDLRPLVLDDLGLNAAVESLARAAAGRMDLEVTFRHDEEDPPVSSGAATALYRIVQETLTNVARHAHATDVSIDLRAQGTDVVLTVQDNGIGLPEDSLRREGSWGLRGLRERAALHGGTLTLDNAPGAGARVRVQIPLEAAKADA